MKKLHITLKRAAAVALVLFSSVLGAQLRAEEPEIAVVVKIGGIPWFTAMEKGIKEAGKEQKLRHTWSGRPRRILPSRCARSKI
jgi:ABC-type sugar transport system substrate-binding protein